MKTGHRHSLSLCAAIAAMLVSLSTPSIQACGMAPPPGMHVGIAGEEALIVWNQATHTEQFIRRASFVGQASQFGFLVPTPTPPKLTEADSGVFEMIAGTYRPHIVPRPRHGLKLVSLFMPVFAGARGKALVTAAVERERVSVLDSEQVAGYNAVVLRADDPAALTQWLGRNGYDARPAIMSWLQPYVTRHWAITAFKLAKPDAQQSALDSPTVRMSFTTDRPFYPYSEPADQRDGQQTAASRLLRVYCVSDTRMDGMLDSSTVKWPGQARWAEPLPLPAASQLTIAVSRTLDSAGHPVSLPHWEGVSDMTPASSVASSVTGYDARLPKNLWLTAFEDKSSPRPGVADLYFTPAAQQASLTPTVFWPEDQRVPIPVELILVGVIVGVNRFQKRRADSADAQTIFARRS